MLHSFRNKQLINVMLLLSLLTEFYNFLSIFLKLKVMLFLQEIRMRITTFSATNLLSTSKLGCQILFLHAFLASLTDLMMVKLSDDDQSYRKITTQN